ncbi:MAG: hypothetical protein ACXVEF_24845 [Polyangiales bacterium]
MKRALAALLFVGAATLLRPSVAAPLVLDRVVARFSDPEATESSGALRFVMMRELVVEAWMVAYERAQTGAPQISDKEIRLALERHVIEAVLASRTLPPAVEKRLSKATAAARLGEEVAVGGTERLADMLERATGSKTGGAAELNAILTRRARAELYLEVGVAQPIEPTDDELRLAWAKSPAGFDKNKTFEDVAPGLRGWVRTTRLREAAQAYYQAVRSKLRLEIVS